MVRSGQQQIASNPILFAGCGLETCDTSASCTSSVTDPNCNPTLNLLEQASTLVKVHDSRQQRADARQVAALSTYIHDDAEELEPLQLVHLHQGLDCCNGDQVEDGQKEEEGPAQNCKAQILAAGQAHIPPQDVLCSINSQAQSIPSCAESLITCFKVCYITVLLC